MAAGSASVWDAAAAIAHCPTHPWSGTVWRYHSSRYIGDDAAGSLKTTGRFNRGTDKFPEAQTWMALYSALGRHVALGERIRHTKRSTIGTLANQRESRLHVELQAVLNLCTKSGCADLDVLGLDKAGMCLPTDYHKPHQIAEVARVTVEALLVPTCTGYPDGNLIVFPDRLRPGSTIFVEDTLDPDLYIDWENLD